jgi:hypothetical protein
MGQLAPWQFGHAEVGSGHSRHSRRPGVSASRQKRTFGQCHVYEYTPEIYPTKAEIDRSSETKAHDQAAFRMISNALRFMSSALTASAYSADC